MLIPENVAAKSPVTPPEPLNVFELVIGAMMNVLPLLIIPLFVFSLKLAIDDGIAIILPPPCECVLKINYDFSHFHACSNSPIE
jgi:hypothetical protein